LQEDACLVEGEAGALGDVENLHPPDCRSAVAALPVGACWFGEHAVGLVVADRGCVDAEALCELTDRECLVVHRFRLDFNVG
jgi:hypothetical protein